ncbi:hypothetical protein WT60_09955 [Burkholderia sp. MSMB617WGS]|nr:hypothetical protein WT60_09955 [Burkholderia sp. MSMB617WGS]KVK82550.1 hypothetical protein WS91_08295 [Burkholderia sp. MSMB1498]
MRAQTFADVAERKDRGIRSGAALPRRADRGDSAIRRLPDAIRNAPAGPESIERRAGLRDGGALARATPIETIGRRTFERRHACNEKRRAKRSGKREAKRKAKRPDRPPSASAGRFADDAERQRCGSPTGAHRVLRIAKAANMRIAHGRRGRPG